MKRTLWLATAAAVLVVAGACTPGPKSPSGLYFPDGDPVAGEQAFVDLRCNACHEVTGVDPSRVPPGATVPVVLGGRVASPVTDGMLITAITNPSHAISNRYQRQLVSVGDRSKMSNVNETMTVRQLADIVSFLHTRYEVMPNLNRVQ